MSRRPDIRFSAQLSFGTIDERQQVAALVGLVLGNVLGPKCASVMLEPLGGGRSGSYVFKAIPLADSDHERGGAPVVVKISPHDEGSREKANYDRFVRPFLPAEYRPDLLGFATANGRAALCYSFVGDDGRPETLTDRLAAGDLATIDRVLSTLFGRLQQSWYGSSQITAEADLARYYLHRYFEGPIAAAEAENRLQDCASRYFGARPLEAGCMIGATAFPSICKVLFSSPTAPGYHSCVIHGDLNSDNMVVSPNGAPVRLVDFPRTGRGHVYQDFVSLEASVRINHPSAASCDDILKAERLIARGEPGIPEDPYARAIGKIRDAAHRLFGSEEEPAAFHFAVAAVGLRLMQATDLSDAARARISASALWAAKMLVEA